MATNNLSIPARGFRPQEILARLNALQQQIQQQGWDGVWLCNEHDLRYYTGFHTQFWHSLTRPWFLVVPANGEPIAIIPSIGACGMAQTVIKDIRPWSSPKRDDDGISLLRQCLNDLPRRHGKLGVPLGEESFLRLPQQNFTTLQQGLALEIFDAQAILWRQRLVKSPAEIAKIGFCAQTTAKLMHGLAKHIRRGQTQREICQTLRKQVIDAGLDHSPFLIAGAGQGGYSDIIMGPDDSVPQDGSVMIIDTGSQFDGYFCDFDRNYAFGAVASETLRAHERLWHATETVLQSLEPGIRCDQIFQHFATLLDPYQAGNGGIGRVGHGLGMGLTEWPSLHPDYRVALPVGAVITIEPVLMLDDQRMLVHEENIVLNTGGATLLSQRTPQALLHVT